MLCGRLRLWPQLAGERPTGTPLHAQAAPTFNGNRRPRGRRNARRRLRRFADVGNTARNDARNGGAPTPTAPSPTATAEDGAVVEARFVVRDGMVDGPNRVTAERGATVVLTVESDVTDHVHVHGYDILRDVEAGGTVNVQFTADIPGVLEVELEDARLELTRVEVR